MLNVIERLFEMSKFRLFLALWTSVSFAILIYMANQSFKPELSAPSDLVSNLDVTRLNTEDILRLRTTWPNILRDLHEVQGLLQALNIEQTLRPIQVKLSSQDPLLFQIESDQIEIGVQYALAPGEIAHALLQTWFMQNRPVQNYSERLKQILYADIFWAAAHTKFELGLPEPNSFLSLSKADIENSNFQDILLYVGSTETTLTSDWAPQGLHLKSGSFSSAERSINPLSLRKFLLAQVLKYQNQLSLNERIEFLKNLSQQKSSKYLASFDHLNIEDLCKFLNQSFSNLGVKRSIEESILSVDALFASEETLKTAVPTSISYILKNSESLVLAPGNILLSQKDLKKISVHTLVLSVRKISDIQSLEATSIKAKKILAIENPRNVFVNFESLKNLDFDRFAKRNKKIQFAVFDQESLSFATKKNLDHSLGLLLQLPKAKKQSLTAAAETLGITNAYWDSQSQTYHAAGTIEALQMWRPSIQ